MFNISHHLIVDAEDVAVIDKNEKELSAVTSSKLVVAAQMIGLQVDQEKNQSNEENKSKGTFEIDTNIEWIAPEQVDINEAEKIIEGTLIKYLTNNRAEVMNNHINEDLLISTKIRINKTVLSPIAAKCGE